MQGQVQAPEKNLERSRGRIKLRGALQRQVPERAPPESEKERERPPVTDREKERKN